MKSIEVILRGEKGDLFTIHAGNDEIEDLETWLIQHYKKKPFNAAFWRPWCENSKQMFMKHFTHTFQIA